MSSRPAGRSHARRAAAIPGAWRPGCSQLMLGINFLPSHVQINVREARDALKQHLQQLSPAALGTSDPPARAAINEAEQLLTEVEAVL